MSNVCCWVSLLAVLTLNAGCHMKPPPPTPAPPANAQRVQDLSALDQARSNQVRLALAELERRFPSGAQAELQVWTLPAAGDTLTARVRAHYAAQAAWLAVPGQHVDAGPLLPEVQIYRAQSADQRLAVLLFRARLANPEDPAVLVVQRAAL